MDQILIDIAGVGQGGTLADRLCASAAERLPVRGAGLSLIGHHGPQGVLAASDGPARELEELQFTTGEGPCIDSVRNGGPVLASDLLSGRPPFWAGFGPAALALGVRAVFAFPLQMGAVRIGALDLYRTVPGGLDDGELAMALSYADAATLVVLHSQDAATDDGYDAILQPSMDARSVVHQATGMVSAQLEVTVEVALLRLRARAFTTGQRLADLSGDVVARRVRFTDDPDGADDGVRRATPSP